MNLNLKVWEAPTTAADPARKIFFTDDAKHASSQLSIEVFNDIFVLAHIRISDLGEGISLEYLYGFVGNIIEIDNRNYKIAYCPHNIDFIGKLLNKFHLEEGRSFYLIMDPSIFLIDKNGNSILFSLSNDGSSIWILTVDTSPSNRLLDIHSNKGQRIVTTCIELIFLLIPV